jgi:hypothetical protein
MLQNENWCSFFKKKELLTYSPETSYRSFTLFSIIFGACYFLSTRQACSSPIRETPVHIVLNSVQTHGSSFQAQTPSASVQGSGQNLNQSSFHEKRNILQEMVLSEDSQKIVQACLELIEKIEEAEALQLRWYSMYEQYRVQILNLLLGAREDSLKDLNANEEIKAVISKVEKSFKSQTMNFFVGTDEAQEVPIHQIVSHPNYREAFKKYREAFEKNCFSHKHKRETIEQIRVLQVICLKLVYFGRMNVRWQANCAEFCNDAKEFQKLKNSFVDIWLDKEKQPFLKEKLSHELYNQLTKKFDENGFNKKSHLFWSPFENLKTNTREFYDRYNRCTLAFVAHHMSCLRQGLGKEENYIPLVDCGQIEHKYYPMYATSQKNLSYCSDSQNGDEPDREKGGRKQFGFQSFWEPWVTPNWSKKIWKKMTMQEKEQQKYLNYFCEEVAEIEKTKNVDNKRHVCSYKKFDKELFQTLMECFSEIMLSQNPFSFFFDQRTRLSESSRLTKEFEKNVSSIFQKNRKLFVLYESFQLALRSEAIENMNHAKSFDFEFHFKKGDIKSILNFEKMNSPYRKTDFPVLSVHEHSFSCQKGLDLSGLLSQMESTNEGVQASSAASSLIQTKQHSNFYEDLHSLTLYKYASLFLPPEKMRIQFLKTEDLGLSPKEHSPKELHEKVSQWIERKSSQPREEILQEVSSPSFIYTYTCKKKNPLLYLDFQRAKKRPFSPDRALVAALPPRSASQPDLQDLDAALTLMEFAAQDFEPKGEQKFQGGRVVRSRSQPSLEELVSQAAPRREALAQPLALPSPERKSPRGGSSPGNMSP